jgi:hypothetical protein
MPAMHQDATFRDVLTPPAARKTAAELDHLALGEPE